MKEAGAVWGMTQHVAVVTGEAAPARGVWNSKLEALRGELEVQGWMIRAAPRVLGISNRS